MTSDEAKDLLNKRLFGRPCNTPEQAKNLLDEIWNACLEFVKSGQEPVALEKLFAELLKGTYSGKESYYNDEQISDACYAKAFEIALIAKKKGIDLYTHPAPAQPVRLSEDELVKAYFSVKERDFVSKNQIRIERLQAVQDAIFEKGAAQPAPYDQQALEPCEECGWKTVIPDEGCLNCQRAQPAVVQQPSAVVTKPEYSEAGGDGCHYEISERLPIGTSLFAEKPAEVAELRSIVRGALILFSSHAQGNCTTQKWVDRAEAALAAYKEQTK